MVRSPMLRLFCQDSYNVLGSTSNSIFKTTFPLKYFKRQQIIRVFLSFMQHNERKESNKDVKENIKTILKDISFFFPLFANGIKHFSIIV